MGWFMKRSAWLLLAGVVCTITGCPPAPTLSLGSPSKANTNTGPVAYTVTYENAQTIALAPEDVAVQATGTATGSVAVSGAGETSRTVTLSNISGDGTLGIRLAEGTAVDAAGRVAPASGASRTFNVDNTAPTPAIGAPSAVLTNTGPIGYAVTYDGAKEITLATANVLVNGTGTASAALDEVAETGEGLRTITLSNVAGDGELGISISAGTASDAAGNLAAAAGPSATAAVDNTAPTLTIGAPSVPDTSVGPVAFKVTYDGADTIALAKANVQLNATGSATATLDDVTATGDAERTVTLSNVIGNGTLGISIAAGTAADAAANPAPEAGPSATFQVENVGPSLLIGPPSSANTFEESVAYTITYADATAITLAPADITLNSDDGVTATIAVTGSSATERTVTLSAFSGLGEVTIFIAAGTAQNDAAEQAPAAGPSAPFSVNPLLQPGSGFTAPTPQPDPIGDPGAPGIDAKAIARWDVVPYQTFDGYFNVGVVAFHINDIDRVAFSVEGGPWTAVREMTLNPETDVVEYWIGLDARDFEDGPIEVRAVAYPKVGVPRVLGGEFTGFGNGEHSILVQANGQHTFVPDLKYVSLTGNDTNPGTQSQPVATIGRAFQLVTDGGDIVLLDAGEYLAPVMQNIRIFNSRWITVRPADGLTLDDVTITQASVDIIRTEVKLVKWQNVSFDFDKISQYYNESGLGILYEVWFDKCRWYSSGGAAGQLNRTVTVRGTYYATGLNVSNMLYGIANVTLARGCSLERIDGDVFQNANAIFDSEVTNVDGSGLPEEVHSDLYQMWESQDNVILYGLRAIQINGAQSIFLTPTILTAPGQINSFTNAAFVDFDIQNVPVFFGDENRGGPPFSQLAGRFSHILFRNVKLPEQRLFFRTDYVAPEHPQGFVASNILFDNVEFHPSSWAEYSDPLSLPEGIRIINSFPAGGAPGE